MVNSMGQLFTIEGIAASLIMIMTVYIVVNTTSVYTAGDTHINDMQLEIIGNDALKMMNTPENGTIGKSPLVVAVEKNDGVTFSAIFNNTLNNRTMTKPDTIQFMANVSYVNYDNSINSTQLGMSRPMWGGEHAVHVSQWVIVEKPPFPSYSTAPMSFRNGKHAALVEVLLWRD